MAESCQLIAVRMGGVGGEIVLVVILDASEVKLWKGELSIFRAVSA